jgi:hypothetical protein
MHVLGLYLAVEGAFGINDHDRAECAKTEATGSDYLDFVFDACELQLFYESFADVHGVRGCTACTAADQDVFADAVTRVNGVTVAETHSNGRSVFIFQCVQLFNVVDHIFGFLSTYLISKIFADDAFYVGGSDSAVNVTVDGHNGCETASTDATGCIVRESAVGRDVTRADSGDFHALFVKLAGALNVASGTETNGDGNLTLGIEGELRVERSYAVYLGNGYVETESDGLHNFEGKITVDILGALKNGHEIAFRVFVRSNQRIQLFCLFGRVRECDGCHFLFHG